MLQKTLKNSYSFEGKGLHTGKIAHMTICPAPENTGIRFERTDLGEGTVIEAVAENVSNTARSTTLTKNEASVVTVEHILSALTGLGVDNALVKIDNIEIPILDGSARPYTDAILADGLVEQSAERIYIEIPEEIVYEDKEKGVFVKVTPADEPCYDITIDFDSQVVGVQTAHWDRNTAYPRSIGRCRTFVFFHELEFLFKNNLIKGGDVDNAIVIVEHPVTEEQLSHMCELFGVPKLDVLEDGYLSNVHLHYSNECARHKMLDMIGDFRLAGGFLKAKITAVKTGHRTNTEVAKMIRSRIK
ncbi:MAG: UDP-3-O-acyl-N-acetylglucosamine deacetylase [Bacteroidales bacterium]|nr:UDP-3-O-acyl-N-acetylglucosamine deacetylase [Bacteroidales bacterium]